MEKKYEVQVLIHKDGKGGLWATVAQLPGVFATGRDHAELVECLNEAIDLYLEETGIPEGMEPVEIQNFNLQGDGLVPA